MKNRTNLPPKGGENLETNVENKKTVLKESRARKNIPKSNRKSKKKERRTLMDDWVTPESLKVITQWKRNGLTDAEVEKNIGVAHSTFGAWKKKSPALRNALKNGRAYADTLIENALFTSAFGGFVQVETVAIDKKTGAPVLDDDGKPITYMKTEYIEPNPKSIIFYLTNRMPDKYKMNRNLDLSLMTGETKDKGGAVEIVVRNEGLKEIEAKAIEEARRQDMENQQHDD